MENGRKIDRDREEKGRLERERWREGDARMGEMERRGG